MLIALTIAHVTISLILIIMVLLQDSKGDASGLVGGGGGSKSVFGATGAATFVVKATRTVAALFAVCCLGLAYLTSHQATSSGVFDRIATPPAQTQPAEEQTTNPVTEEGATTEAPAETPATETK